MESPDGWSYATRWQHQYSVDTTAFVSADLPDSPAIPVVFYNPSDDESSPSPRQYTQPAPWRPTPAVPSTSTDPTRPPPVSTKQAPPGWTYGNRPAAAAPARSPAREPTVPFFSRLEARGGPAPDRVPAPQREAPPAPRHSTQPAPPTRSQPAPSAEPPITHSARGKWERTTNTREQPSTPFQQASSWENRASAQAQWRPTQCEDDSGELSSPGSPAWENLENETPSRQPAQGSSTAQTQREQHQKAEKESKAEVLRQRLAAASARRAETLRAKAATGKDKRRANNTSVPTHEQQRRTQAQYAAWERQERERQGGSKPKPKRVPPRSRSSPTRGQRPGTAPTSRRQSRPRGGSRAAAAEDDSKWDQFVSRSDFRCSLLVLVLFQHLYT